MYGAPKHGWHACTVKLSICGSGEYSAKGWQYKTEQEISIKAVIQTHWHAGQCCPQGLAMGVLALSIVSMVSSSRRSWLLLGAAANGEALLHWCGVVVQVAGRQGGRRPFPTAACW